MVFIIVLIVYLLLGVYLYLRIASLLDHTYQKILLALFCIVLMFALPMTEILSHANQAEWTRPVLLLGYYSLPFYLYLFLSVLMLDVLLGINRLLKVVRSDALRSRNARIFILSLLLAVPVLVVIAGSVKFSTIKINEYKVSVPRKSSTVQHVKIALVSDLHLREITDPRFLERFVSQVNALQTDILLIPGDVLEGDRQDGQVDEFERQFRKIKTTYGVYVSLGNHEFYRGNVKLDFFQKSHMTVLPDTVLTVEHAFTLVGRYDSHNRNRKTLDELMRLTRPDLPVVVLDHRPTDLENISMAQADIVVSGHTHHGQLSPFNYITEQLYEISWGYKKIRNTHAFVTSGLQTWGAPVRTAGDSEVMVINVDFVDGSPN